MGKVCDRAVGILQQKRQQSTTKKQMCKWKHTKINNTNFLKSKTTTRNAEQNIERWSSRRSPHLTSPPSPPHHTWFLDLALDSTLCTVVVSWGECEYSKESGRKNRNCYNWYTSARRCFVKCTQTRHFRVMYRVEWNRLYFASVQMTDPKTTINTALWKRSIFCTLKKTNLRSGLAFYQPN